MKTIIIYESTHHGNTKKLVDAIAAECGVQTMSIEESAHTDLTAYDCIGIASGIAFGKFYAATEKFVAERLPEGKKVFFLYTCGKYSEKYVKSVSGAAAEKRCEILGSYGCPGYDTYGPFKLVGGISKGHPTDEEVADAVKFYKKLI